MLTKTSACHSKLDALLSNNYCAPNNDKAVSCFVTIQSYSPEMFYSFRWVSQFSDMWEWNLDFMQASMFGNTLKPRGELEPSHYCQGRSSRDKGTNISSFTEVSETRELPEYSHSVSVIAHVCKATSTCFWRARKGYSAALPAVPVPWNLCTGTLYRWGPEEKELGGGSLGPESFRQGLDY